MSNPIEGGVEQAYQEIRSSLEILLRQAWNPMSDTSVNGEKILQVLYGLDDAVSNNFEKLMDAFWIGVAEDVANSEGVNEFTAHIERRPIYGKQE